MTSRTLFFVLTLSLTVTTLSTSRASAQVLRRGNGPVARTLNSLPISPWMWSYYNQSRRNQVIILPNTVNPSQQGNPANGGAGGIAGGSSSSSNMAAATPTRTVEIKVVLPVAGATITVNGIDFGKTEYYERKLNVPEAPDGITHEYTVSANWTDKGKAVTQERKVKINRSGKATANFLFTP